MGPEVEGMRQEVEAELVVGGLWGQRGLQDPGLLFISGAVLDELGAE